MIKPAALRPGRASIAATTVLYAVACSPALPTVSSSTSTAPITAATAETLPPVTGVNLILDEARNFVFRARNSACLATGTAFALDRRIITNRHVAAGATDLQLNTWEGIDFQVAVAGYGSGLDLAALSGVAPGGTSQAAAAGGDPTVGAPVYVAGYPEGNQLTVTAGVVAADAPDSALGVSGPVLELTDKVLPGNSGSPVLNQSGQVVGVVYATDTKTGDGLAMPLSSLTQFLASPPSSGALPCTQD